VRFMETLLALIVKFQAGELAAVVPGERATAAGGGRKEDTSPRPSPQSGEGVDPCPHGGRENCGLTYAFGGPCAVDPVSVGSATDADGISAAGGGWDCDAAQAPFGTQRPSFSPVAHASARNAPVHEPALERSTGRPDTLCAPPRPPRFKCFTAETRGGVRVAETRRLNFSPLPWSLARGAGRFDSDSKIRILAPLDTGDSIVPV
jgi:hypothetical protein